MTRLNWTLLVLVALLAALAWWLGPGVTPEDRRRLFPIDREGVRRLVVENAEGRFVFARADEDADWAIVEPERYPASLAVAMMVAALESVVSDRPLLAGSPDAAALARAGLDVGAARFEIDGRRGRIGAPPAIGSRTPVVADDRSAVCSVASFAARLFHRPLAGYRASTAVVFDPSEWAAVRFEWAGHAIELRNPTGNRWRLVDPSGALVDPGAAFVRRFTDGLPRLEVVAWLDDEAIPERAFAQPERIIVSWGADEPWQVDTLEIGAPRDEATRYARRREGPVFAVRAADVAAFFPRSPADAVAR